VRWAGAANDREYVERILELGTTPNGVFGLKLQWTHLETVTEKLRGHLGDHQSTVPDLLAGAIGEPLYIWLRRHDRVAQAVSLYRAILTDQWHEWVDRTVDRQPAMATDLTFDFDEIEKCRRLIAAWDKNWESFFAEYDIAPIVVLYEEFVGAYEATINAILRALAVPPRGLSDLEGPFRRQADELSAEWIRRFAAMLRDRPQEGLS
jgi:LPS sulfotransferase NodH